MNAAKSTTTSSTPAPTRTASDSRAGTTRTPPSGESSARDALRAGGKRTASPRTPPATKAPTATKAPSTKPRTSAGTTAKGSARVTATSTRSATGTRTSSDRPLAPTTSLPGDAQQEPATTRASVRRTGTSRTATSRAARRQDGDRPAAAPRPVGHSAVEALLADYPGEGPTDRGGETPAAREPLDGTPVPAAHTPRSATTLTTRPAYPPAEDVALGVLAVVVEGAWRAGSWGIAMVTGVAVRAADVVRAVSPTFATELADAHLASLAERGRAVRQERTEALSTVVTDAVTSAATSDAMRQMSVAAIEEATDDVLAVVLPAMLEAVTELEMQEKLDELMAGLLMRQLPSALEKTLPGVMMRTAAKPAAGLNALLSGVLPKG
jgi:hypothetical protein